MEVALVRAKVTSQVISQEKVRARSPAMVVEATKAVPVPAINSRVDPSFVAQGIIALAGIISATKSVKPKPSRRSRRSIRVVMKSSSSSTSTISRLSPKKNSPVGR